MPAFIDLVGKKFDRLTVISRLQTDCRGHIHCVGQNLKDRLKEAMNLLEKYPDEAQEICFEKARAV